MMLFAIRIEDALNVTVQGPHDADAREHRRAAKRRDQDQRLHCRLPLWRHVLGFRKLGDVAAIRDHDLAELGLTRPIETIAAGFATPAI